MIKQSLFSLLLLLPLSGFGFSAGSMADLDDSIDNSNAAVSSDTEDNPDNEEEQLKVARFRTNDGEAHLIKVGDSGTCLQSPTNKLYKELSPNPNRVVDFLNKEFGASDSGARWYIVSC